MSSEAQVYEREGVSTCDSPAPQESTQESWEFLPLDQAPNHQDFAERLALLRHELVQIEAEMTAEEKVLEKKDLHYVSELVTMAKQAELVSGDLDTVVSLNGKVTREVTQSLFNKLDTPFRYTLAEKGPTEAVENTLTASLIGVSARLAKLEETLGQWKAENNYGAICETLSAQRLRISQLDGKGLDALNARVEGVTTYFNMVTKQLSMMQAAATEQRVLDEMFAGMELVEQIGPLLPQILLRLETIKRISEEGSRFSYRVAEIQERQRRIEEKLGKHTAPVMVMQWNKFKEEVKTKFRNLEKKIKR